MVDTQQSFDERCRARMSSLTTEIEETVRKIVATDRSAQSSDAIVKACLIQRIAVLELTCEDLSADLGDLATTVTKLEALLGEPDEVPPPSTENPPQEQS